MMAQSVLERQGEHIAESARKMCQMTSAFADAMQDGVKATRRVAKRGGDAAEEFLDDTSKRLQRHPIGSVVLTFALGVTAGILIGRKTK